MFSQIVFAKGAHYALPQLSNSGYDVVGLDWTIRPEEARYKKNILCHLAHPPHEHTHTHVHIQTQNQFSYPMAPKQCFFQYNIQFVKAHVLFFFIQTSCWE